MKKYWRRIKILLWICLMSAAYLAAALYTDRLNDCRQSALILMERSPLSAGRVSEMQKLEKEQEHPRDFAAWTQKNGAIAENADLARSHTVSAVTVCGRSDLVMRGTARLEAGDASGCLVDEHTAIRLFGSTDIAGQTILLDGEEKIVRGILYDAADVVLCEAAGDAAQLQYLTVFLGTDRRYAQIRQDFMMRHSLQGEFVRLDLLSCSAGLLCLHIDLPADMIPTKWSDFTFWKNWWKSEREDVLRLLLMEKEKPMQTYVENFYRAVASGLLCWFFAAAALVCLLRGGGRASQVKT